MPEAPFPKVRPHPACSPSEPGHHAPAAGGYAELDCISNFSFLEGASHADELVEHAAALGHTAIAIADTHSLAGIVRAHVAAKRAGIQLVVGSRVKPTDAPGLSLLLYPTSRAAYANLCRLLTLGKRRAPKGQCHLTLVDIAAHHEGLLCVLAPPEELNPTCAETARTLRGVFDDDRLSIAVARTYTQDDDARVREVVSLAERVSVPVVATNAVHFHSPQRRRLRDVLTCIKHGCTVAAAGWRLAANSERHLKPADEMARLFAGHPGAIARTREIAARARGFSLDQLKYEYPDEIVPQGSTPMRHLAELTRAGAATRYPQGVPASVQAQIDHELRLIDELNYAPYFLTVEEIVRFARSRGILCQGRGAAANSAVCYCLGVTAVDPARVSMLFERFISKERDEPPDIDIDFEHERREEVIQHLYAKYGRDRAALTAEVISYRGRSAIREVGKAMGLSADTLGIMAKDLDWWSDEPADDARLRRLGLNPREPTLRTTVQLAREIMGFPRHLSQHVGGFVITRTPLSELVPIENAAMQDRTVIEWDKDDIEAMGMLKVDVLGLGMLSCLRKTLDLVSTSGGASLTLATIPPEDPATYDMACKADTVGVFQIESRAQMSMLPRLKPRCYYDLVIEVAIVRPGPIQGKMVHPYIRRRNGEEPVEFASPEIERVLGRTLGVPLFQEQAMALAVVAAGFTPGEADQLRRAIASWKRSGSAIKRFEHQLISGMQARGHTPQFAAQVFQQISGFSGYGFPESHAASFALLVYSSAWLKRHHPAAFAAGLINSQPMGFYQPAQIIRDAQAHGVEVRPVDVSHSQWDCTLEPTPSGPAIRLGMRLVRGLSQEEAEKLVAAVEAAARAGRGLFRDIPTLWRSSSISVASLRLLAQADAFNSLGLSRQRALWAIQALKDDPAPLFEQAGVWADVAAPCALPAQSALTGVSEDYRNVGLSLKAHPMRFAREALAAQGVTPNAALADPALTPAGSPVTVAGLVLVRQRPGTASGIVFMTIEDETGVANLIVRPKIYERFRAAAKHSQAIAATGIVERQGDVVHVMTRRIRRVSIAGESIHARSRDFH
ncbi:MAG: DNA polymerase III subunit alpha [Tepidisphaera sp.]|nr:DNA polymerase III subunit alpha [Tepidisphaera sp.]